MSLSTVKNRFIAPHITEKVFEYLDPDFLRRMSGVLSHCGFDYATLSQLQKAMICERPLTIDRPLSHSFFLIGDSIFDQDLKEELCNDNALAIVSAQNEIQKLSIHAKTQVISSTHLNFPASLERLDQSKAVELTKICMKNNLWRCLHLLLKHNKNIKSAINLNILDAYNAGHREVLQVLLSHPLGQKLPKAIVLDIIAKFDLLELFPLIEKDLQSNGIEGFIKELSITELTTFSFHFDIIKPLLFLLCDERDISFELSLQKFRLPDPSILTSLQPYITLDHLPKSARPIYQLVCSKMEDYSGIPFAHDISERGFEMLVCHAFYQGHLPLLADLDKLQKLRHRAIPFLDSSLWKIPDSLPSLHPLFRSKTDLDPHAPLAAMILYEFVNNTNPKWTLPSRDLLCSLQEPLLRYQKRLELRSNSLLSDQMLTIKFLLRCLFPLSITSNEKIYLKGIEDEKVNNFLCKNVSVLRFDESFNISFELLKLGANLFMHSQREGLSPNFVARACKGIYERVCKNEEYASLLSNFVSDVLDINADYHKKILIECHKLGMIDLFFSKDILKYTAIPIFQQITWSYYSLSHAIDLRLIPDFDAYIIGMEAPAYSAADIRILLDIFFKHNQEREARLLFQVASKKTNLFKSSHLNAEKLLTSAVRLGEIKFVKAISKQKNCPIAAGILQECMKIAKEKNDQEMMRNLFFIRPSLFGHRCLSGEFSDKNDKCYKDLHTLFGDQSEMIELAYAVYMLLAEDKTYLAKKMIQDPICLHASQSIADWFSKQSPLSFADDESHAAFSAINFIENCFIKDQHQSQDAPSVKVLDLSIPKERRTLSALEFFQERDLEDITPSQIQMLYDEIDGIPLDLKKSNLGIVLPFAMFRRLLTLSNRLYGDKEIALHLEENPFLKLFYSGFWQTFFGSYSLFCRQQLKMKMETRETKQKISEALDDFEGAFKHLKDFLTSQSLFDPASDVYDPLLEDELSTLSNMIQLYKEITSSRSSINILYEKEIGNFPQLCSHQEQEFNAKDSLDAAAELIAFMTNLIGEDMPIGLSSISMFAKTLKQLEIYRKLLSSVANKDFDEIKPVLKNIHAKLRESQKEWAINCANIYASTQMVAKDSDALIISGDSTKALLQSFTSVVEKTFISREDQRYNECAESMQRFAFYFSLFSSLIPPKGSQPSQVLKNLRDQMTELKSAIVKNQPRDLHSFIKQQTQSMPSASSFERNKGMLLPFIDLLSKQSKITFDQISDYLRKVQDVESFTPEMLLEYLQILAVVLLLKHDLCTIFDMERPSSIEEVFIPLVTIIQEVSNKKTSEISNPKKSSKTKSKRTNISSATPLDQESNIFETSTPASQNEVALATPTAVEHVAKASPLVATEAKKKVEVPAEMPERAIEVHDVVRHLKNESVRAIMKFFKECGFDLERIHGDHRILSNPLKQKKCILPGNLGDTVKNGTLRSVVEQSGVCELQQDALKEMMGSKK